MSAGKSVPEDFAWLRCFLALVSEGVGRGGALVNVHVNVANEALETSSLLPLAFSK